MNSLWQQTSDIPSFRALEKDIKTDILIIGGGMAGILCAYLLNCEGADYVLAEAETLCSGITKNTTAKITSQHGLIYDKLIREFGKEKAKQYYLANEAALHKYREICGGIDCDFEKKRRICLFKRRPSENKKRSGGAQRAGNTFRTLRTDSAAI